jgi:hypothetical protein
LAVANKNPGLLGKAQRTWLRDYLNSSDEVPTLIFVHHTLGDEDWDLTDGDRLLEIVQPFRKVKAILCGHGHDYAYSVVDGLHVIRLPALGFAEKEPVGWVDASFRKDGGDFTLRAIAGNTAQNGRTTSLRWRS